MEPIIPIDEINKLKEELSESSYISETGKVKYKYDADEIEDAVEEILYDAYINGTSFVEETLKRDIFMQKYDMDSTVNKKVSGKTWRERIREYIDNGSPISEIIRVVETEAHRDLNESIVDNGKKAGARTKTWKTMEDDRVRDAHVDLDNQTVGINEKFYTWDGYKTDFPGGFGIPELDVNCRCYVELS